jgi:hypothetical protein
MAISKFQDEQFILGINSSVSVAKFSVDFLTLHMETTSTKQTFIWCIEVSEDRDIIVGDIMKSLSVYRYEHGQLILRNAFVKA